MTALSDLLAEVNTDRLSNREIARRTEKSEAGKVDQSTVAKYTNGTHGEPEDRILRALAQVLPVKLSALRAAAGVPIGARGPYTPPDVAHRLDARQRRALDELIRAFVATDDDSQETTSEQGATITPLRRAARSRPSTEPPKTDP